MTTRMVTVPSGMLLADAARFLIKNKIGSAPVVEPGATAPAGELSRKSCTDALLDAVYEGLPTEPVADYMQPWKVRVSVDASIVEMVGKFRDCSQRLLPVFREDRFVGVVTRSALIRALLAVLEHMPDHQNRLLYLSAITDRDDAPGL